MKKMTKQWISVLCVSLLFTIGIFLIHYIYPSIFSAHTFYLYDILDYSHRIDHYLSADIVEYHTTHPAFVRRPLVTGGIELVHQIFEVSYAYSFIFVNFLLLFLCGIILYRVSREYGMRHISAIVGMILFYTSFSILLAFTFEMSTYDDLLQYILVWLVLCYLMRRQWYGVVASLFLALWARETTMLLIPAIVLFVYPYGEKLKHAWQQSYIKKKIYIVLMVSIVYIVILSGALYYFGIWGEAQAYFVSERWGHLLFNFQNQQYTLQSILSLILVLGFPLFILGAYIKDRVLSISEQQIIYAFLVSAVINTIVVFATARVQEARLLALPLLFVWPVLGEYTIVVYKKWWRSLKSVLSNFKYTNIHIIFYIVHALFLLIMSYIVCFIVFSPAVFVELLWIFRVYLFSILVCIIGYYFVMQISRHQNYIIDHT